MRKHTKRNGIFSFAENKNREKSTEYLDKGEGSITDGIETGTVDSTETV